MDEDLDGELKHREDFISIVVSKLDTVLFIPEEVIVK
jgi:hypothetical protein